MEEGDQVLEDVEEALSENREQTTDNDEHDMSSSSVRDQAKLLDALNLELSFRSTLSPRQERETETSPTLYCVAPPLWYVKFVLYSRHVR